MILFLSRCCDGGSDSSVQTAASFSVLKKSTQDIGESTRESTVGLQGRLSAPGQERDTRLSRSQAQNRLIVMVYTVVSERRVAWRFA
jgi:hypothetical protein